jgi:hypothetical protein
MITDSRHYFVRLKRRSWFKILFLFYFIAFPQIVFAAANSPKLSIQENSLQKLRFGITISAPSFSQQKAAGRIYDVIQLEGFTLQNHFAAPALPTLSYTVILPPEGDFQLRFTTTAGERFYGKNLLPSVQTGVDARADSVFYKSTEINPGFILPPVRLVETGIWRGFRLGRVEIIPLQSEGDALQFFSAIDVQIEFLSRRNNLSRPSFSLTNIEQLVLKPALNFAVAQIWRAETSPPNSVSTFPFLAASPAIKIAVEDDGLYSISYRLLDSLGVNPNSLNPPTFQIWNKGRQISILLQDDGDEQFEPGETIEFFGERLVGEASYHNHFTKKNIYWLTFAEEGGKRMARRNVLTASDPQPTTANYFWDWRHFEEEKEYYSGDNDEQIFSSATSSGETWIWSKLRAGELFQSNFAAPAPISSNAPACSLRARIRGMTVDPATPSHHLRFRINNNTIGEIYFDDTEEIIFRAALPGQWLRDNNIFQILSDNDTGAEINQIYIDWFEIGYWRQYDASSNTLAFREPQNTEGTQALYKIDNLNSSAALLFDRRYSELLEGFAVTPVAPGRFQISFIDSASAGRDYFLLTQQARRTPDKIWIDTPSDLHSLANAADYILITPTDFLDEAKRLAEHRRQHVGRYAKDRFRDMRVAMVDVEDIYDEFSFGIPHPEAVREFLRYAYSNWQKPAPTFVCLFGDASLDPNFYAIGSNKVNFIFSLGNPASDNRLACLDGAEDFLPEMFIGRLTIETAEQAQALVDKIIFYERAEIAEWNKTFIFLNGGITGFEQEIFRLKSESLIEHHVLATPVSGRPVRIYKTTPNRVIGELRPEIISAIDAGAFMLTFSGHAASQNWELMFVNADVADLRNRDLYPFIASMTCHTARFANADQNSFGEAFLRPPDKGAIAFWGTSGFGFIFQDGILLDSLYTSIAHDTVRYAGVATTLAKIGLWKSLGNSSVNVNSIDQYTLLGDPALQLALPTAPDLSMTPGNITVAPNAPTEDDLQVRINAKTRNLGLATTDSVDIEMIVASAENGEEKFRRQTRVAPIGWADSLSATWLSRGSRGDYRIQSEVDRLQKIAESNESNNAADATIFFAPSSVTLAAPADFSLIKNNQPVLHVYNPSVRPQQTRTYFFEIDSTADFNSSAKIASPPIAEDRLRTSWQIPSPLPDCLYFWRNRMIEGNRASSWQVASFGIDSQFPAFGFRQAGVQLRRGIFEANTFFDEQNFGVRLAPGQKQGTFQSTEIGPAKKWQLASGKWELANGSLQLSVLGRSALNNEWKLLKKDLITPEISLIDIDARQFPFLRLQAIFRNDDPASAGPLLTSWAVTFDPNGDFATGTQVVNASADSILEGEKIRFSAEVFHFNSVSTASAEDVQVTFSQADSRAERGRRALATYNAMLLPESSQRFAVDWNSEGSRGANIFFVEVDPGNQVAEPVEFNNSAAISIFVQTDQTRPQLEVTFDDQIVVDGDFVSSRPKILCKISDDSLLPIADTSRVQVFLDEQRVSYSNAGQLQLVSFPSGPVRAEAAFRPQLSGGKHVIEFFARDASNNAAYYRAEVQVDTEFHLREVMNYPNPFRNETDFTYYLTQPADEVAIKIFTLSGRLIATIENAPNSAGFNRLHWNGLDADGDVLANGVYLYKLIAKSGERKLEEIQKCVVMR